MRKIAFIFLIIFCMVNISYACSYSPSTECTDCKDCAVVFEWTTEGIPSPVQLTSLFHQLLPIFEDVDCVTIASAGDDCIVLKDPVQFLHFDYSSLNNAICESTTLTFYDCDGGTNTVPIPGTGLLLISGVLSLGYIRRKKNV